METATIYHERLKSFSWDYVYDKIRPDQYFDDLKKCAVFSDDKQITVNLKSQCWLDFKKKYENYEPTEQDHMRHRMRQSAKRNIANNDSLKRDISPKDLVKAILPVLTSVVVGKDVPEERQKKRLEICADCEYLSLINNQPSCGICGCQLKIDDKSIVNLISKEETSLYGCKHPDGSKWKLNDV
jgi:hypothetical protein